MTSAKTTIMISKRLEQKFWGFGFHTFIQKGF